MNDKTFSGEVNVKVELFAESNVLVDLFDDLLSIPCPRGEEVSGDESVIGGEIKDREGSSKDIG